MSTLINVTQPQVNEILVSSPYIQALGNVSRLGELQIKATSTSNALIDDIFFKFYTCDDSTGTKVYTPLDVSGALAQTSIVDKFLTLLFANYYSDSNLVTDIGGSFPDLRERFLDTTTPTNAFSTALSMPSSSSNFVEFVNMGVKSYVGAALINGGSSFEASSLWGNRVGQVHVTSQDPLAPGEKIYDNSESGCWQFSDYNTSGIIVYTNLLRGCWQSNGLNVWNQVFAVWPIIADVLNADYACMFSDLDTAFLKHGLSYFDRFSRIDSFYGWSGNFLQSVFNEWSIPLISPIWALSNLALSGILTRPNLTTPSPATNYGSLTDPQKRYRVIGPLASNNVHTPIEKMPRTILNALWANECLFGAIDLSSSAVLNFENTISTMGYALGADYFSACIASVQEGFNAHIYKYLTDLKPHAYYDPVNTIGYIENGVSWFSNLANQPDLGNVFCDRVTSVPKYFQNAIDTFYGTTSGTYGEALTTRISTDIPVPCDPMKSQDIKDLEAWVYTP